MYQQKEYKIKKKRLTKLQKIKMLKLYKEGNLSILKISSIFNVSSTSIIQMTQRKGLYKCRINRRKINSNAFDKIDNESKAYWLGFLVADGCVCNGRITFRLAGKDYAHLVKFRQFLKSTHLIKREDNHGYPSVCFSVTNRHIANSIRKLGIPKDKSHNLENFPDVPKHLRRHFLRGLFDGDGCFNVMKIGNHRKLRFIFISTIKMAKSVQKELMEECLLNKTKLYIPKHSLSSAYITYNGNKQLKRIYDYFYKDATVYLERKKKIADSIF